MIVEYKYTGGLNIRDVAAGECLVINGDVAIKTSKGDVVCLDNGYVYEMPSALVKERIPSGSTITLQQR